MTGFLFPFEALGPPHIVGAISLVVLAVALAARYVGDLDGAWRWIYVVSAVAALYFNVFVAVAQAFGKIGFLHQFAPTGSEPPFAASVSAISRGASKKAGGSCGSPWGRAAILAR